MIEIFIYSFFTSIFIFSSGIFFSKKIINLNFKENFNLFQIGLYGFIFLSFLALVINFVSELNKTINTAIFILFLIYLFRNNKDLNKKIFLYSLFSAFICLLILTLDNTYRPDAGLYHLPFTKILNEEKIIIGLSNIHFRFGHTSIIQYLSALNNNWIFGDKGILIPLAVIFSFFILYLIYEIKNEKNSLILIFNFIIFSFICLKLNRYSDFGNDAPAHIYYFFLTSLALKKFKNFKKENMSEILSISVFIIFNKITLFLSAVIPIIILLLHKKKFNFLDIKIIIFLTFFSISFFGKNFIISGCFAFPVEATCVKKVFWYDANSKRGSNAKNTMLENEAWTKGWSDQKENAKNFEEYLSNFDWIKLWSQNHGKRTLIKILPFLTLLIFLKILISILTKNKKEDEDDQNKEQVSAIFLNTLLILNILGTTMWFLKFPVFRYGYSYLISNMAFLFIIVFRNQIIQINLYKLKDKINYIIIALLIVLLSKNLIRIQKNYNSTYSNYPWPKIYAENKFNFQKNNKMIYKNNKFLFYQSKEGLCYYNKAPCTHMLDSQFSIKEIKFKLFFSYKAFYF